MYYNLIILAIIVVGFYLFAKKKHVYWEKRGVPHPKPTLLFGNTGSVVVLKMLMSHLVDNLYTDYKDTAYVGFYNFLTPAVVVRDVELIKEVMIKQFNSFHDNWVAVDYSVDPVLAKNPFVMRGQEWKIVRTQLTPQYTAAKVKLTISMMQEVSTKLIKYIEEQIIVTKSNCLELKGLSTRFTGENVLACAYGLEGNSFIDEYPITYQIGDQIASHNFGVQIKQCVSLFFPTFLRKLLKATFVGSPIPKVYWDMILNAIKYREENNIIRKDYLDFLKELRNSKNSSYELNDAYIVAHAFTFFLDGFETSASALMYSLYELSLHSESQVKAREEVETVVHKYKGELSYEALTECNYLENVIFESLRLNPVLPFLSRVCTHDYRFPSPKGDGTGDEVVIQKGTQIFIPVYKVHRDSRYYPNPEKFDPNRFSEDIKSVRPKGSFLGFGEGPRICLGRNFAIAQIKMALIAILKEFELRISTKTKLPHDREVLHLLNIPKNGIYVEFYKRTSY